MQVIVVKIIILLFFAAPILNRKLFDAKLSISIADRGKFWAFVQPLDFYIGTRVKALVSNKVYLNTHKNKKTDFRNEVSLSFCLNLMVFLLIRQLVKSQKHKY